MKHVLEKLLDKRNLAMEEAYGVMSDIMEGKTTPAQIGAFLIALRLKGETVDEVSGFAQAMRDKALRLEYPGNLLDTCGTGGDGMGTINISTLSAFVVAGAGVKVAKHGNRSVSSLCGSADLLEGLGVKIDIPPSTAKRCLDECNFSFLFAPLYHPAMRYAAGARKEIGVRTVFNILGPLTNPARVKRQLLGVFSPSLTSFIASVLGRLGVERAMVVSSLDGMDEISVSAPTKVSELRDGTILEYTIEPERLGVRNHPLEELKVKSKEESVRIAEEILAGEREGAVMDAVLINSAAALIVAGMADDLKGGMEIARESIRMGLAMRVLETLRRISEEEKRNGNP
ncbi:anthranilate phosphoribosyltransferase [bacterium]|nr:anthranilate phosphoribosyltransferase [bacterium]